MEQVTFDVVGWEEKDETEAGTHLLGGGGQYRGGSTIVGRGRIRQRRAHICWKGKDETEADAHLLGGGSGACWDKIKVVFQVFQVFRFHVFQLKFLLKVL